MDQCIATAVSPLKNAKKFLIENPTESRITAARIFGVNRNALAASIRRDSGEKKGGQNKILSDHDAKLFMRKLNLYCSIGFYLHSELSST